MNTNKLKAKDLITTAIFSVVMILVFFACSMTFGMIPVLYPFLVAFVCVPGGIIWAYMRVKVPKRYSIIIQCTVIPLVFFLIGSGWSLSLGFFIGGILCELISGIGKYKNFKLNTIGYAAFALCVHIGAFLIALAARDYYFDFCVSGGMTAEWTEAFLNFMTWPVMLGSGVLSIIGAVIGMMLGKVMLKKHFKRAGIA
jgi:energy-coupling factor transport system substrate-specific component